MKTKLIFTLTLVILFSAAHCSAQQDAGVPPDLGKEPTTILILETERKALNKAFSEVFAKEYTGAIEVIPDGAQRSDKYADTVKYRYLISTTITFVEAMGMGATRVPATYDYEYDMLDRQTGKHYGGEQSSDAWKHLLKKYARRMEKVRQANGAK